MTPHEQQVLARLIPFAARARDLLHDDELEQLDRVLADARSLGQPLEQQLICGRCQQPLGDEPSVTTTYDDVPPEADTEPDELVVVHARCAV